MGIKGLNTWIHASFPGVMRPVDGRGATYDHVLFDLNGIVHQACRRCPKEKEVLRTIIRELDELLLSQALHAFGEDQSPVYHPLFVPRVTPPLLPAPFTASFGGPKCPLGSGGPMCSRLSGIFFFSS